MNSTIRELVTILLLAGTLAATLPGATSFDRSVRDYYAAGPVTVLQGQRAHACALNLDESPVAILIGLLVAGNGSVAASQQVILQPGTEVCIDTQNGSIGAHVVAVVVPNGHLDANNAIVQDRPGGGCITASLQIQTYSPDSNSAGQTLVYAPLLQHHSGRASNPGQQP